MKDRSYTEAAYLISQVSEILDIHPQTLRQYEREGLIVPSRSDGRIRLYSLEDIDKIKFIIYLTRQKGVNLSGIKIILELYSKIEELENYIRSLQNEINTQNSSKALVVKKTKYDIILFKE